MNRKGQMAGVVIVAAAALASCRYSLSQPAVDFARTNGENWHDFKVYRSGGGKLLLRGAGEDVFLAEPGHFAVVVSPPDLESDSLAQYLPGSLHGSEIEVPKKDGIDVATIQNGNLVFYIRTAAGETQMVSIPAD